MAEDAGRCMEMELKVQLVKLPKKVVALHATIGKHHPAAAILSLKFGSIIPLQQDAGQAVYLK